MNDSSENILGARASGLRNRPAGSVRSPVFIARVGLLLVSDGFNLCGSPRTIVSLPVAPGCFLLAFGEGEFYCISREKQIPTKSKSLSVA